MRLIPYIIFNGNCEEALNFYAKAVNGKIKDLSRYGDAPVDNMNADKQKVINAVFEADGFTLMASDTGGASMQAADSGMVHLSLDFTDTAEEEKVFNALSEDGQVTMPLQDTFWGARFGMLTDKFGVKWMFNCDKPKS